MRPGDQVFTLLGKKIRESEKAILFRVDQIQGLSDPNEPIGKTEWFPFSQVNKTFTAKPGSDEKDYIIASKWICEQKESLVEWLVNAPTPVPRDSLNASLRAADGVQEVTDGEDWEDESPF